jgi:aminoglycoside 3-N-acetyltransferase I
MTATDFAIHRVTPGDVQILRELLGVFGEAFEDVARYRKDGPSDEYLERLLRSDYFIAIAAVASGVVVGGLAGYELRKFEQERSEIYVYDLAVASSHRRQGIATALIAELREIAAARRASVIFVQADQGDTPAIELYSKFGEREEVLHFDISVPQQEIPNGGPAAAPDRGRG